MTADLRAPFPWFGGKSRVAPLVWERFGKVSNYVEPFFGSGAVLLGRPGGPSGVETVNDLDGMVANFWRAVAADADEVARCADSPVNEADLHARHVWLIEQLGDGFAERLMGDPDWFDPKVAGWWVWGLCSWIGSGWCSTDGSWWPDADGRLTKADAVKGVHRQRPHLGNAGPLTDLAVRFRRVRVCCGDWTRVLGDSVTTQHGTTGVFFDPPYSAEADRDMGLYRQESGTVAHDVRGWCVEHGDNPELRIALCGYAGEGHDHLTDLGWTAVPWKAHGGMGNTGNGRGSENRHREVVWFSPHCLDPAATLFGDTHYDR